MRLIAIMLVVSFGMHGLPDLIALAYDLDQQIRAVKAWEYIFRGFGGFALCLLVGILSRSHVAFPVSLWAGIEQAQTAVCRLAHPIGGEPPVVGLFSGLCGKNWYQFGLAAALLFSLWSLDQELKEE